MASMIQKIITYSCRVCGSTNIIQSGDQTTRITYFVTTTVHLLVGQPLAAFRNSRPTRTFTGTLGREGWSA